MVWQLIKYAALACVFLLALAVCIIIAYIGMVCVFFGIKALIDVLENVRYKRRAARKAKR